jgi:flagellar basal-body rod protein FlgB
MPNLFKANGFEKLAQRLLEGRLRYSAMIDALFNQPNYVAAKKLLDATVMRHEAIASNLANVETPNYRRVDVDTTFKAELSRALTANSVTDIQQITPEIKTDDTAVSHTRDGNTVQLENELIQMSQNTLSHAVETQFLTGSLVKLKLAITGRSS